MEVDGVTSSQSNGHSNHIEDKEETNVDEGLLVVDMPKAKRSTRTATAAAAAAAVTPDKVKKRSNSPAQPQPRSSKRQRLQYQPFQSPGMGHISIGKGSKSSEDKMVIFYKGEFLALRNEIGSFFVCQAAQNVYKSSRKFKIRWLSRMDTKEEDLYSPDFYDFTDFECVLTNLRMERRDKNIFRLPKSETTRTENILRRALNLENGIREPELDQVEHDGVDVSLVRDEIPVKKSRLENSNNKSPTLTTAATRGNSSMEIAPRSTRRQIKQQNNNNNNNNTNNNNNNNNNSTNSQYRVLRSATVPANSKKKMASSKVKMKTSPVRLRPRVVRDANEPKDLTPKKEVKLERSSRKSSPREKLKPNNRVTIFNKDPTFETNMNIPVVSVSAFSKQPIRAVLTRDMRLLQTLIADSANVCSVQMVRSVDQSLDALAYALIQENHKAIQLLLKEILNPTKKRVKEPDSFLIQQTTGKYELEKKFCLFIKEFLIVLLIIYRDILFDRCFVVIISSKTTNIFNFS